MTFKELAVGQRFKFVDGWEVMQKTSSGSSSNYRSVTAGGNGISYSHEQVIAVDDSLITGSQTPRTDAVYAKDNFADMVRLAKQLERELAESLAREQKLRDDLEDIRTILGR